MTTAPIQSEPSSQGGHEAQMLGNAEDRDSPEQEVAHILRHLHTAAQQAGLLSSYDVLFPDGSVSEAASQAIEELLEQSIVLEEATEAECQRYYALHPLNFRHGLSAHVRHILFAVTASVKIPQLIQFSEAVLQDILSQKITFEAAAQQWSNCPSVAQVSPLQGDLGRLTPADCAPEFARALWTMPCPVGLYAHLIRSRFGLHIVEVLSREEGQLLSYEEALPDIKMRLQRQAWANAAAGFARQVAGHAG